MTKLTYPDFRDAMRKHGEYTKARLDGLYVRYMRDDIADCVAEAIAPKKVAKQADETMPVAIVPPVVVKPKIRPEAKNFAERVAQIQKILSTHGQPMNLEQIAVAMEFTVVHTGKIMSKMVEQNLVLVTKKRVGQGLQHRYSLAQDAGWRD